MSRMMRRVRGGDAERGAIAVFVAILFGSGVLLGMGALVVDAGGMYAERAQLQNGADAGSLAVALGCAKGAATCDASTAAAGPAGAHANSNANDAKAKVDGVCGRDGGLGILPTCNGSAPGCPAAAPAAGVQYAQVQTSTLTTGGGTLLPPAFGKAVLGSGYQGKTVHACALASWGAPGGLGNAVAFTISYCEWQQNTANGTSFATYPPWPPSYLKVFAGTAPAAQSETILRLHGGGGGSCNAGNDSAGWDAPGAFGWVGDGSSCSVPITNNTFPANTGNNALNACVQTFQNAYSSHTPIFIPVYDGTTGTGNNVLYTLKGFAAFIITGWDFTSGNSGWSNNGGTVKEPSLVALSEGNNANQSNYCHKPLVASNSDVCVDGFFTKALIPASALPTGGGQNLGAIKVSLVG
jgi:hypothetical protein